VRVLAPVPHDEVPDLLSQAHVGVLPFPDEEKFRVSSPIKLFEYMASGMPILATRVACHTDVVGDGTYTFWAEDESVESLLAALRQVWRERNSLGDMALGAATAAEKWTWQESGRDLKRALEYGLSQVHRGPSVSVRRPARESNG
jgi:glycosyltransferase involved in cell wall biosynthesis